VTVRCSITAPATTQRQLSRYPTYLRCTQKIRPARNCSPGELLFVVPNYYRIPDQYPGFCVSVGETAISLAGIG